MSPSPNAANPKKLTIRDLNKLYSDQTPIVTLTAYDSFFGRMADEAGCHIILVGDTLGMTVLGFPSTIPVTMDHMLHHTAAVSRGVKQAFIVGDMPFLSCDISTEDSVRNAGRLIQEAGADCVKLEGGKRMAPTIKRMVDASIPVMGHVGLLPQQIKIEGRYRVHGRNKEEAEQIYNDAVAVQDAGAFSVVLEGIPASLAKRITDDLSIPTIGIGAGPHCSGQVQVCHDILGMFEDFVPKHTKQYAQLTDQIRTAYAQYISDVTSGTFPTDDNSFQ
jgi:3-methyl-2-oxobutanoate hydroxymethyltransferase